MVIISQKRITNKNQEVPLYMQQNGKKKKNHKKLTIPKADKNVEQTNILPYTAGGNAKRYGNMGRQFGRFLQS